MSRTAVRKRLGLRVAVSWILFLDLGLGRRQIEIGHSELALELDQLFEVDRPNYIYDGEFLRLDAEYGKSVNLITGSIQIDLDVIAILLAGDADYLAPGAAAKL